MFICQDMHKTNCLPKYGWNASKKSKALNAMMLWCNDAISSIDWFARQFLISILNIKLKSDVGVLHTLNDWDGIFLKTIGM